VAEAVQKAPVPSIFSSHGASNTLTTFKETMKIVFDDVLPKWNYRAIPSGP
jgi:hypothetical protein